MKFELLPLSMNRENATRDYRACADKPIIACESQHRWAAVITAYKHFGLKTPPFEGAPDPRFFYATASHEEALATTEFAIKGHKACTMIVGEAGSGKTLIARLAVNAISGRTGVLWVHGLGQPAGETLVTVCPPGSLKSIAALDGRALQESSLAEWIRKSATKAAATVLVIDNADGLGPQGWQDVLAVVTREIRAPHPLSVLLLGLPALLEALSSAALVRLRRRVFRTCELKRLSREDVERYVRHRLELAGCDATMQVFTRGALELIHRLSGGNPALVNQLCDNALVDAYGDDRHMIDGPHVLSTVHAITGGNARLGSLLEPLSSRPARPLPLVVPDEYRLRSRLDALTDPSGRTVETPPTPPDTDEPAEAIAVGVPSNVEVSYRPLDERLRALETRLSGALERVRCARAMRDLNPPPKDDQTPEPTVDSSELPPESATPDDD